MSNIFGPIDVANYINQQGDIGRERGERSYLGKLYGQAATAAPAERSPLYALMGQTNPEFARGAEEHFANRDQRSRVDLAQEASDALKLPAEMRPQWWAARRDAISASNPALSQLKAWEWNDVEGLPLLQQVAGKANDDLPSDIRTLRMLQEDPSLLETNDRYRGTYSFDQQFDAEGRPIYNRRNNRTGEVGTAPVVAGSGTSVPAPAGAPGEPSAQPPSAYADVQAVLDGIGQKYGFTTTSTVRSPQENLAADGVPTSQHLATNGGTARDFSIKGKSPQEIQAMVAELQSAGFEVINSDHGTGPHIHAELPSRTGGGGGGGQVPHLGQSDEERAQAAARKAELEARARKTADLQLDLQYAPDIAAAAADKAAAERTAVLGADRADTQVTQGRALSVYQTASQEIRQRMKETTTNPVSGRLPAVTPSAQIAEGARSQMAPVLKSLFRSAGEGVFTDKDQELLMAMLPDRGDYPSTVTAKMDAIDALVAAKLNAAAPAPTQEPAANDDDELIRQYLR